MKIKTLNGEKEVNAVYTNYKESQTPVIGVSWADIKPILDEYAAAIENDKASLSCESVGCSDYGLMKGEDYEV